MSKIEGVIFDMDGCLYPLDRGSGKSFNESEFGKTIKARELLFIQNELDVNIGMATIINNDLKARYNHHLSLALENEHGISRELFFNFTWDLQPEQFIDKQPRLSSLLNELPVCSGLLTAAPKCWAKRVLEYLDVTSHFCDATLCGDQNIRKPDPRAFLQVVEMLDLRPEQVISIGDQEQTDILPAQSLGMLTMRIGDDNTCASFQATDINDAINQLNKEGLL